MKTEGSRAEVMHGNALRTAGGLMKKDLKMSDGRIISKKQQAAAKKNPGLKKWRGAVKMAKKDLDIPKKEFALIKGNLLRVSRKYMKDKK